MIWELPILEIYSLERFLTTNMHIISAGLIFGTIGTIFLYSGFKELRMKKLIEGTPTYKIRAATVGLGEIYGKVVPAGKIEKSPFTHKKCVYMNCIIDEYGSNGKSRGWIPILEFGKINNFYIDDGTGKILVNPARCDLRIENWGTLSVMGGTVGPSAKVKKFLKKNKIEYKLWFGKYRWLRFREDIIEPGDTLYVFGTIGDNPYVEECTAEKGCEDLMMQKGEAGDIYIISDKSEKELLGTRKFWYCEKIVMGAILMTLILITIVELLNF